MVNIWPLIAHLSRKCYANVPFNLQVCLSLLDEFHGGYNEKFPLYGTWIVGTTLIC